MNRLAAAALLVVMFAIQGCSTVSAANNAFKTATIATRIVSSTGDLVFDHDGDGK
jgi:hypothetical protein